MPKVTIDDVAELAGVSIKTVSRVVNQEPNVREATRAKVDAAIAKLNYRPNKAARSLASHLSHLIGLIYDDPGYYEAPSAGYVIRMQQGALSACHASNYELLIHPCQYRKKDIGKEIKTLSFGDATVVYDYQPAGENGVTLSLSALVSETNNSLRGLKNTDPRRLSKLGELIYQCRLLLYKPARGEQKVGVNTPVVISQNYSLFTGVDLPLASDERVGIQAQVMQAVDDASLFSSSLGDSNIHQKLWENVEQGQASNMKQINVNVLQESNVVKTAENLDIVVRFPVFQVQKPVREWSYHFDLKDFRLAVQHTDENCTPDKLMELIDLAAIGAGL